jgi:hypothetical protein
MRGDLAVEADAHRADRSARCATMRENLLLAFVYNVRRHLRSRPARSNPQFGLLLSAAYLARSTAMASTA